MANIQNDLFSVGLIHNQKMDISKKMNMEVILHNDKEKGFHYKFSKGKDKLNCIFGIYKTLKFSSIRELGETILNECSAQDVFISGLASYNEVEVLVPSEIQRREIAGTLGTNYITRQKHNFNWVNTPGIISIDIDGYMDKYFTEEEAIEILYRAVPEFKNAPILIKPSTSSCVYYNGSKRVVDEEGNEIRPEGAQKRTDLTKKSGLRFYIVISSLTWLHKAKEFLETRLWNIGYGYLDYDVNGNENFRCLIDLAMYSSTDRADFIKASVDTEIEGFLQDFGELTYLNEDLPPLDVGLIKDLTEEEKAGLQNNKAKARIAPNNVARQKRIKELYLNKKIKEAHDKAKSASEEELTDKEKEKIAKRVNRLVKRLYKEKIIDRLHPIYIFENNKVKMVTTDEIFKNEESARKYHGMYCASVLDPFYTPGKEYRGDQSDIEQNMVQSGVGIDFSRAKILSCNKKPSILDQAHGGRRFYFDTEFFDIARVEKERKITNIYKLPTWNLTQIVNCFLFQWDKDEITDVECFGNVLKELESKIVDGCVKDLIHNIFIIATEKSKLKTSRIWKDLTGYGPSLYEFMIHNKEVKKQVDLDANETLVKVNRIDVRYRLRLLDKIYTKIILPKGDVIFQIKKFDEKSGWYYDDHQESTLKKYYFEDFYYGTNNKDETVKREIINLWLKDLGKKKYPDIAFYPIKGKVATYDSYIYGENKDAFNFYTGLNLVPKPKVNSIEVNGKLNTVKGWHLFDKHIKEILCNNEEDKYQYLLNWIANMYQYPNRQGETILAFQSEEGAGKNTVWDPIMWSFGKFAEPIVDGKQLTGQFNDSLSNKLLILLNEAVWEGDVQGHGKLKSIATEPYLSINEKYKSVITIRNTLHIVIMTNHAAVAPMGVGDRRIVTFDVNDRKKRNEKYFNTLREEIYSGGIEAFVYDMLNRDISDFSVRVMPNSTHSESAINSIMNSADAWLKWLFECLQDDTLYGYEYDYTKGTDCISELLIEWKGNMPSNILFSCFNKWKEDSGIKKNITTQNAFSRKIKKLMMSGLKANEGYMTQKEIGTLVYKKVNGEVGGIKRPRNCFIMKDLDNIRKSFSTFVNRVIDWDI